MSEYLKVKDFTYLEYCDYLHLCTSMNESFNSWTTKNNSKLFKEIKELIVSNNKTESLLKVIKTSV